MNPAPDLEFNTADLDVYGKLGGTILDVSAAIAGVIALIWVFEGSWAIALLSGTACLGLAVGKWLRRGRYPQVGTYFAILTANLLVTVGIYLMGPMSGLYGIYAATAMLGSFLSIPGSKRKMFVPFLGVVLSVAVTLLLPWFEFFNHPRIELPGKHSAQLVLALNSATAVFSVGYLTYLARRSYLRNLDRLSSSHRWFNTVLEMIADSVFVFEESGRVHWCNQTACQTWGYSKQDFVGQNIDLLGVENLAARILKPQGASGGPIRLQVKTRMGQWIKVSVSVAQFAGTGQEGERTLFVAVLRDVS